MAVLSIAVSSKEEDVRRVLGETEAAPRSSVMGTPDLVERFGVDATGNTVEIFYGAPPDLNDRVRQALSALAR